MSTQYNDPWNGATWIPRAARRRHADPWSELQRREALRREAQRREAQRREELRHEALRRQALRREALQHEAQRREAQRHEEQRREVRRQEQQRREAQLREAQRQEEQLREAQLREAQRQEEQLREAQLREAQRQQELPTPSLVDEPPMEATPASTPPSEERSVAKPEPQAARTARVADLVDEARQRLQRAARIDVEQQRRAILNDMLEVYDDLERTLAAAVPDGADDAQLTAVVDGVAIVRDRFLEKLAKHGAQPVASDGEVFDPRTHEAIGTEAVEAGRVGTVVRTLQRGFTVEDDILRPARVVVGAA